MEREQKNQDIATIATTATMDEIQEWMSKSTFDAEIRQQIGIFCARYKTFKQIAKAYPKGSGEFLEELKNKQNNKLSETQRAAVGVLFEKIEQSEQSALSGGGQGTKKVEIGSVYEQIKVELALDEYRYRAFQQAVEADDTAEVRRFLKDVAPFKSNSELLSDIVVLGIMHFTAKNLAKTDRIEMKEQLFDVKVDNEKQNTKISKTSEQSQKTQNEQNEIKNEQKKMEDRQDHLEENQKKDKKVNRFKFALFTLFCILSYVCLSIWGIAEHGYDLMVAVETGIITVFILVICISELRVCKEDDDWWIISQLISGVCFGVLGVSARAFTLGPIDAVAAVLLYATNYILSGGAIIVIIVKHKAVSRCRNLKYRECGRDILTLMRLNREEKDSVSGDTETDIDNDCNSSDNNYKAITLTIANGATNQQNDIEGENDKDSGLDEKHSPPATQQHSQHDIIPAAGSQESVTAVQ